MKITFIEAAQSYGGAQIAMLDLAVRLKEQGDEILIIDYYGCCRPFVEKVQVYKLNLQILHETNNYIAVNKYKYKILNFFNLLTYIPHLLRLRNKLKAILDIENPDIVLCYNHKTLSIVKRKHKFLLIYYAHRWYIPKEIGKGQQILLKYWPDRIFTVSQATRMALYASKIAPLDRIEVLPNAITPSDLPDGVANIDNIQGKFKILMCGGFLPDKGLHIAVEIAKKLKDRDFPIKLIIAGIVYQNQQSQNYYLEIKEKVKSYHLEEEVEMIVDNSNVIPYFRACDCLIHPSMTEGLPLVIMEAMSLRKPVIANAAGGIVDLVLDGFTGIIVRMNNVQDYVNIIEKLYNNPNFANFLVDNAEVFLLSSYSKEVQLEKFKLFTKK